MHIKAWFTSQQIGIVSNLNDNYAIVCEFPRQGRLRQVGDVGHGPPNIFGSLKNETYLHQNFSYRSGYNNHKYMANT